MGYTAGDKILDDQYNAFVNNSSAPFGYNHFAGTGSGEYGLGQTHIGTQIVGDKILASHWNTLFTGLDNIANHTNASITATTVESGDTIAIKSALETDLATLASAVAAGSTSATAIGTNAVGQSTNSGTWNSTSTIERSLTFSSADALRHFFNAGGFIRITCATSGSVDGNKDTEFSNICSAIGNLDLKAHATTRSGTGQTQTSFDSGNGFHDLGTGYSSKIKITSSGTYNSNFVEISAKLDAAVGTATVLTIKMVSSDPAADTTYTSGNLAGVPTDPNKAPAMQLTLVEHHPTNAQGLSANIQASSNAEVSNSQS